MTDDVGTESSADAGARSAAGPDTVPGAHAPAYARASEPETAGGMLRAARQAQGMDLAALAAMLKVPLRRIEALEQGRHAELQGPTFERALAQAACRVLKIDPKPVLARMPAHEGDTLVKVSEGLNTPFRERQGGGSSFDAAALSRPVVIVPALIVVAALALFYVPEGLWTRLAHPVHDSIVSASDPAASASTSPASAVAADATAPSPPVADAVDVASAPTAAAPDTAPPVALDNAQDDAPRPSRAASAATPAAVSATAAAGIDEVLAHSEAAPGIPLQVVATADSWVEVVDAQGHSLLSRTVVAGESVGLDGALPMKVKIGNARGTRLTLRGDNVDLAPWTRDNVARLELK